MDTYLGVKPDPKTLTVTPFHRVIRPDELVAGSVGIPEEIMGAAWAVLLDALASATPGSGVRIHVKIEVERPA